MNRDEIYKIYGLTRQDIDDAQDEIKMLGPLEASAFDFQDVDQLITHLDAIAVKHRKCLKEGIPHKHYNSLDATIKLLQYVRENLENPK